MEKETKELRSVMTTLLRTAHNLTRDAHTHSREADRATALVETIGEQAAALRKNDISTRRQVERLEKVVSAATEFLKSVEQQERILSKLNTEFDQALRDVERIK